MGERGWVRVLLCAALLCGACGAKDEIKDAIDIADGVPRKTIDVNRMGLNAFANDARFGSISEQFLEVRDVLGVKFVRILFHWGDAVQPAPGAALNMSFYDDLAAGIPAGLDALVVVTGLPSWMYDSANWIDGNPRTTFIDLWLKKVVRRYRSSGRIVAFQVWNEPNLAENPDNALLGVLDSPDAYIEMLSAGSAFIRSSAPGKLVVNAATVPINGSSPDSLGYNKRMRDLGGVDLVDVWGIHYYGKQYENVIKGGGVADFLNGLGRTVWITESGARGVNNQLAYVEEVWPFLREHIPVIDRIYYYQFTDSEGSASAYGLRNPDAAAPVSDLYNHLAARAEN